MMTFKRTFIPLVVLVSLSLLFLTCRHRYSEDYFHSFDNRTWNRFEKLTFEFPVSNTRPTYSLFLQLKHDSTWQFPDLPVNVIFDMPSGEERINEYSFKIMNDDGVFKGQYSNGTYELLLPLWGTINFSREGTCKVEIEDLIPRVEITGIQELNLVIKHNR
jgi:gliding motility-associated lipoprotein GldH